MNLASMIILIFAAFTTAIFLLLDFLLMYLSAIIFMQNPRLEDVSNDEKELVPDFKLPIISILLPVYREEITLPYLIESIANSDYPKDKLDIRILVEHDDHPTIKTIMSLPYKAGQTDDSGIKYNLFGLPKTIRVWRGIDIQIDYIYLNPPGARTKPNSLNKGLSNARGSIVTIYDAEDRPEPDQLRKVAVYMLKHPEVACAQARLSFYNSDQSLLTKLFSIEYIEHFLILLPALYSLKKVVLLGGTSNFIRIEVIRNLKGWKTDNVTEDADLGVRLARLGYNVVPINSTTWEEATPKLYPWIRQRTRWNKGFLYTWSKHFKNPMRLIHDIGFSSTLFLFYYLIAPLTYFISIIGWILFIAYWINFVGIISTEPLAGWIQDAYTANSLVFYASILSFIFGIVYDPFVAAEALFKQGDSYSLKKVKYVFLMPFYLYLQILPSILAIIELFIKPKHWRKTYHGFSVKTNEEEEHPYDKYI
ncbi:MAG: glycosyltransferase [Nitrososphaeraceae archaeon]|nr:glycosyltransferase [Nitrososphaeraceae archaeon]